MELNDEFEVSVPVAEAWVVLTDVEKIAPCLPGIWLRQVEGDEYQGVVKVKVGPVTVSYGGSARFELLDADAHKAVLKAEGRERRGQGCSEGRAPPGGSAVPERVSAARLSAR